MKHSQPSSEAQRGVLSAALVFLTLAVGSTTSLVLSNATLSETFSSARDILGGLTLYALVTTLVPLAGIACISLATSLETPASFTSICAAGLCFALTGAIYERLSGIGRVGWWVGAAGLGQGSAFVDAVTAAGGPVLVDALIGACALAVVQIVWVSLVALRSNGNQAVVDLLAEDVEEVVATPERRDPVGQWRKPVGFLASVAAAGIIAPLVLASHVELVHPAPNDPGWTYPPLRLGCVSPPEATRPRGLAAREQSRREQGCADLELVRRRRDPQQGRHAARGGDRVGVSRRGGTGPAETGRCR